MITLFSLTGLAQTRSCSWEEQNLRLLMLFFALKDRESSLAEPAEPADLRLQREFLCRVLQGCAERDIAGLSSLQWSFSPLFVGLLSEMCELNQSISIINNF